MKSIEWALAMLFGSVSLFFLSMSIGVMLWAYYKLSARMIKEKEQYPWITNLTLDEEAEYEISLEDCVKRCSRPV